MRKTVLLLSLALAGCSSSQPKEQPQAQPRIQEAPAKASPAQPAPPPKHEEPIAITIKKGDKHGPEAAYKGAPPPGMVCFDFKNVDLEEVALPLFSKQAGVLVEYHGLPRKLTLGLNQPLAWRDALGLLCQFTNTHVVRSQVAGRLELKDGYADPNPILARFDPNDKSGSDAGAGVIGGDASVNGGASSPDSSSPGSTGPTAAQGTDTSGQIDTSDSPHEGTGGAEMRKLLGPNGVTPNNSGGR